VAKVSTPYLEPAQWYASLPTVYTSALLLLTNAVGQVLVVKPSYRPYWALPGGIVEADEAPHTCAEREAAEELGLTVTAGDLLVCDWSPPMGDRPRAMINFLFDGGVVSDPDVVRLQEDELEDAAWVSWDKATELLPNHTAARVPAARRARATGRTVYLPTSPLIGK
jgi:8-oxo-dGTP pyrophosphatase MutT (NUDIX family)